MHRAASVMACLAVLALTGCTIYSEQKSPGVTQTTSAEQVDRIFWQDVEQAKWVQVNALLAPNAVWRVNGQVIPRAQIVPWLQSLGTHGVQVSDVALLAGEQVVDAEHVLPALQQPVAQVRAEKAGAARDENALG